MCNSSDPFGLCPDPKDPKCKPVIFAGVTGSAVVGVGPTGGAGVILWSGEGPGIYMRTGAGAGADVGAAGEAGGSTNMNSFTGESTGGSASMIIGGGVTHNASGTTATFTLGPKGADLVPAYHYEQSYTEKFTLADLKAAILRFIQQGIDAERAASGVPRAP